MLQGTQSRLGWTPILAELVQKKKKRRPPCLRRGKKGEGSIESAHGPFFEKRRRCGQDKPGKRGKEGNGKKFFN